MRKHLSKLYKKKNRHPTQYNIDEYKVLKTKFARTCRQAQTKGWNEFTDSTDSFDKMNVLKNIFEGKSSEKLGTLEKPDGSLTDPG